METELTSSHAHAIELADSLLLLRLRYLYQIGIRTGRPAGEPEPALGAVAARHPRCPRGESLAVHAGCRVAQLVV